MSDPRRPMSLDMVEAWRDNSIRFACRNGTTVSRKMTPGLQRFKGTLVYAACAPSASLLNDLARIAALDARIKRFRSIAIYVGLAALLVFLVLLVVPMRKALLPPLITVVVMMGLPTLITVVFLLGLVAEPIAAWWFSRTELSRHRYGLLGALIKMLGRDILEHEELDARLDLASPVAESKRIAEGQIGIWKTTHYRDPWLQFSGRFADGTSFRIIVAELWKVKQRWSKSRSGKNKSKSKSKARTQVMVSLYPKARHYGNLNSIQARAMSFLQLPAWVNVKRLEVHTDELTLVTTTMSPWSLRRLGSRTANDRVEMVARMLLSLYQILHVSKADSK